jgi:hypothetical protein
LPRQPVTHCKWNHDYTPENTRIRADGKRVCRQCERDRTRQRDATRRQDPARREYLRNYGRAWLAKRRADWLADKACATCGSTERLEIDHIDPATKDPKLKGKAGTGRLWSWSDERRQAELAKCQVLCEIHHKMKTHRWTKPELPHGRGRYDKGCRCYVCRSAKEGRRRR